MSAKEEQKKDCPHCNAAVPLSTSEKLIDYGRVLKPCPNCGKLFFDKRINELAIDGITKDDKRLIRVFPVILLFIGIIITAFLMLTMYWLANSSRRYVKVNILEFVGPVLIVVGLYLILKDIFTYKKRQSLLEEELINSKKRFEDPEYATLVTEFTKRKKSAYSNNISTKEKNK